jgi:hypothetical protein
VIPIDTSPPLAWELHSNDGPRGDITWKGGTDLHLNTGPRLRGLLEPMLSQLLGSSDTGMLLTGALAHLREISGGAVWATPVPRHIVVTTLNWNAAAAADGGSLPSADPAARYAHNEFPLGFDIATMIEWTQQGKLVWEPSKVQIPGIPPGYKAGGKVGSEEYWVTVCQKPGTKTYLMAITQGPAVRPQTVEQSDGLLRRCKLGKLYDLLNRGSDI